MKLTKNTYCSYCGEAFTTAPTYPRQCQNCNSVTYVNPLPVAVVLLPIEGGLLTVRRNIEPKKGMLALPGGFIEVGESWQKAASRELFEETGFEVSPEEIALFDVHSAPDGMVLIFGIANTQKNYVLSGFESNQESSELMLITGPVELAFPLHNQVVKKYFGYREDS